MECPHDESIPEGGREMRTAIVSIFATFKVEVDEDVDLEKDEIVAGINLDVFMENGDIYEDMNILETIDYQVNVEEEEK
jgi:hypothetical protein